MTQDKDAECLRNVVQKIIDGDKTEERIIPSWVATKAMENLDATELQQTKPLVYLAAHLQLRQIARHACRKQFEPDPDDHEALDPAQQELFPGLQFRYPAAHSEKEEPSYVLRDAMTAKDVTFNVKRLRREGNTKLGRADALEAWWGFRKAGETQPQVRHASRPEPPQAA
jgi:hypothetical protein